MFNPLEIIGHGMQSATNSLFPSAAGKAMPFLNQMPGQISPYYQPYVDSGHQALGQYQGQVGQLTGMLPGLQNQYQGLMNNPQDIISRLGGTYHQSPGYQFNLNQGEEAINNAAAAGGMAGSPQHQYQAGQLASNFANQDYNQYMDRIMGLFGQGLQGSQGLYGAGLQGLQGLNEQGYGASTGLAGDLASILSNKANLGYAGQNNQNQMSGNLLGQLMSLLGGGGLSGMGSMMAGI